ncbi:hypothetical protein [Anabaena azotica]|uniref:Uncharacterized protein n=1 Tax=Anabaena azotica FACHB-119 TaxID=947527 RepID=A0ABR8CX92_9NOST|nr:hypothetical protein [Anabaena azotica]MBD2499533.1 hypothetical protein [Anabaena azotica FACHB-119]
MGEDDYPTITVAPERLETRVRSATLLRLRDRSYEDICIPLNAVDLDCHHIPERRLRVNQPDPYGMELDVISI